MVIKKIAAICKSRKTIDLFDDDAAGIQWISDGCAIYPLYEMPEMDNETILAVLDVPEDKRGEYHVTHSALPTSYNFTDSDDTERMLDEMDVGIVFRDRKLLPARTSLGLWFFNPKYLEPLNDMDGFEIYERETMGGQVYLAVRTGWILRAIILPMLPEPDALVERLEMLARELRTTIYLKAQQEKKEQEAEADQYDSLLTDEPKVDAETGEAIE